MMSYLVNCPEDDDQQRYPNLGNYNDGNFDRVEGSSKVPWLTHNWRKSCCNKSSSCHHANGRDGWKRNPKYDCCYMEVLESMYLFKGSGMEWKTYLPEKCNDMKEPPHYQLHQSVIIDESYNWKVRRKRR